jgi:hypothetical protein
MRTHDWVLVHYWIPPYKTASYLCTIGLFETGVDSFETVQALLELGRKALVGLGHICEQGVTAASGPIEQIQECGTWWLGLESDIGVPRDGVGVLFQKLQAGLVVSASVNEVDFWESLGCTRRYVDVMTTKVTAKFQRLLNGD